MNYSSASASYAQIPQPQIEAPEERRRLRGSIHIGDETNFEVKEKAAPDPVWHQRGSHTPERSPSERKAEPRVDVDAERRLASGQLQRVDLARLAYGDCP